MNSRGKNFLKGTGYLMLSASCGLLSALTAKETSYMLDMDINEVSNTYLYFMEIPLLIATSVLLAGSSVASAGATVWHYTKAAVGEEKAQAMATRASKCCSSLFSRRPAEEPPASVEVIVSAGYETPFLSQGV